MSPLVFNLLLVVISVIGPGALHAASFTPIGDLRRGDFDSQAYGVSADGAVVIGTGKSDSGNEAFIWDANNGMQKLQDFLTTLTLDMTGWHLSWTSDVSADGLTVVGFGTNPSGFREAFIASVSELSTALMLGLGALGVAGLGTRRRPPRGM